VDREHLIGVKMLAEEGRISERQQQERRQNALANGLESAASITDRMIPLFRREPNGYTPGGTWQGVPFLEDMRALGGQNVAVVGAPLDAGTTFRSGTRFGPGAMRRLSAAYTQFSFELGVDLRESLTMVDVGDVTVIPANIEKSFDQIDKAIAYIHERDVFPVVLGGDHSIGYPDIRGLAPYIDGNIGIIHFDRHADMAEYNLDERMHGTPFFHATNIENAPPANLVQIGVGGWINGRPSIKNARAKGATSITISDIDRWGLDRIAEIALETAWKNASAVFLSFDIDSVDPAFAPGTGTPEAGGLLPREIFRLLHLVSREGLAGMEVVEVSPPYDVADITSILGVRVVLETLSALVLNGKLGSRPTVDDDAQPEDVNR
jgi:agmatinase